MTTVESVPPPTARVPFAHELTELEHELLRAIAEGEGYRSIGRRLGYHEQTIGTRAARMFAKLGARDRAHAVHIGHRVGLLS